MNKVKILSLLICLSGAVGCFKDLNTIPLDPDVLTAEAVYKDPASYKQVLAKLYAGLAVSGQQGPSGQSDIFEIDEGFGQYLRGYWYHQELATDEAVIGWNDQSIKDFHSQSWGAGDAFIYAFYSRVFYQISLANEFMRETTDEKLTARNVDAALKAEIQKYRAEVRFLRALSYWHGLDLFRNTPFATEDAILGVTKPTQTNANDLFAYIESELLAIDADLAAPRTNDYGRADKAAAWMLLAKLYLNAEVYTGRDKYNEALQYSEKVINAGYALEPVYKNLFLADNQKSNEIIFPVNFDGVRTRTWGGMTFIIRAGIGGSMNPVESGVVSGWGGTRTTRQMAEKFPSDLTGIKVDFNQGQTASYPKVYVPGSHQGFDATQTSNSLASVASNKIYEGYKYFPDNNTEIYFTQISSNTAPKFGDNGADGTLETNGAKIIVAQAGLYYIKVNLNNKTYSLEKQAWSITGTATEGAEISMDWDVASGMLVASAELKAGTFKFKTTEGAAINMGDTGADALLERDGAEIALDQAGGYKIFLDLDKPDYTYQVQLTSFDRRGIFYTDGQNIDIDDLTLFTEGYAISKFKNVTSTGQGGSDTDFPDTDFPMFRLADAYLMASEAILRGAGGGDKNKAVQYFNVVRERAFTGASGNYTAANLNLDVMLDERARELYWECHRRTDLIRFGKFTDGNYLWAWKGGVKEGKTVPAFRNIYPIPSSDLGANTNLTQNPGY
jgi:SusD family